MDHGLPALEDAAGTLGLDLPIFPQGASSASGLALDGGEDGVGGLGPTEGLRVGDDGVEAGSDRGFPTGCTRGSGSDSILSIA